MPVCEFGERQYELGANLEFLAGSGQFFAPTTVLEKQLGIDVALTPGDPAVWALLGVSPPRGVQPGPGVFARWPRGAPSAAAPPFLTSLFVQYKRSTYLTRRSALEWADHDEPYWRIELSHRQHQRLLDLEAAVRQYAVVRYAAPRFFRHRELWQRQGLGDILNGSLFIRPSEVANRHERITWSPQRGVLGHSEPERLAGEEPDDLARAVIRQTRARAGAFRDVDTRQHLAALAGAVQESTLATSDREDVYDELLSRPTARELIEDEAAVELLADIAVISEAAHLTQTSWLLLAMTERD